MLINGDLIKKYFKNPWAQKKFIFKLNAKIKSKLHEEYQFLITHAQHFDNNYDLQKL